MVGSSSCTPLSRVCSSNGNRKSTWESFFGTLNRKLRLSSARRRADQSQGTRRRRRNSISTPSSPSAVVSQCQSFSGTPLPRAKRPTICCVDSGILGPNHPKCDLDSKKLLLLCRPGAEDAESDIATASFSSDSFIDGDDPSDSHLTSDLEDGIKTASDSPLSNKHRNRSAITVFCNDEDQPLPSTSPKRPPLFADMQNLQITQQGVLSSGPESRTPSPRTPETLFAIDSYMVMADTCPDLTLLGSGQCSSPGLGSGHKKIGGDFSRQLLWLQNRCSLNECCPVPSPRMKSPGSSSRIQSVAATPFRPRAGGPCSESPVLRPEDSRQRSHRLPLPPLAISNTSSFVPNYSRATSPTVPQRPARAEKPASPGSRWKKGRLLGSGFFGHVYLGFDRESGEMCAMKEVTLFPDDPKSKESKQQLNQEITMLSCLRHPNIVRYYGSETIGDKLYIYLEYVSGGSIFKLLQEYGKFGENAIRSYTQQILSGLAYLHSKNTIHRDIKGANILVDPNGRVKLADFGMAKHISGQHCQLSFKGSPYWMAPEVINNTSGYNLAVDIWSLGCTILEMADAKPPWSQYEGVAAMFKIGNSKELPVIPDHLSDEGKDFVRLCLQRNPSSRPSAAKLLEHPFVRNGAPLEKHVITADNLEVTLTVNNIMRTSSILNARDPPGFDSEDTPNDHPNGIKIASGTSTPIAPSLRSRSPQRMKGMVPPLSSPCARSGATAHFSRGSGGIALHLQQQQPGGGPISRLPSSFHRSNLYQDHDDPECSRRWSHPTHVLQETISPGNGEVANNRQSLLAEHVSQQLLGEELSFTQYLDQKPSCSPPARVDRT